MPIWAQEFLRDFVMPRRGNAGLEHDDPHVLDLLPLSGAAEESFPDPAPGGPDRAGDHR